MSDDLFAELDAEITAAVAKKKLKADAPKLKKQAHNLRLSPRQREQAAADFKAVQSIVEANQWEVARCGALFTQQSCDGCGSINYNFLQYMQEEFKVRDNRSRRWIRVTRPVEGLPLETIIQPLKTHICSDCCEDHGLNVLMPSIILMPISGSLTVSSAYTQGDINAPPEED